MDIPNSFEHVPLLTPVALNTDWKAALAVPPRWAPDRHFEEDTVHAVVGDLHRRPIFMPPTEWALLWELTRFGHSVVTNSNAKSGSANARIYVKLSWVDAPDANIPVRRIFSGADEGVATRALEIERDYSAINVEYLPDSRAKWDAREVAINRSEKLALERASMGFDVGAYTENIRSLFAEIDRGLKQESEAAE